MVVSIFVQVVIIIYFILLFLLSSKFLYLSMMNNVILTRRNLVILITYKLIMLTVLQSRKIGSAYALLLGIQRDLQSNKITQLPEK